MNDFSVCLNLVCLLVQSALHLLFVSHLTGKRTAAWHFAAYFLLLEGLEWISRQVMPAWPLVMGVNLVILWGITCLLLGNSPSVSWIAAIIALYISQLSFGVVNSMEAIVFPYQIGTSLLYLLIFLATLLSFVICACCYRAVFGFLSLAEGLPLSHTWMLLYPILFFSAAELYIMQTSYTQACIFPTDLPAMLLLTESGKHIALLILQMLGLGALLCTLYAHRRVCQDFLTRSQLLSLTQAVRAQKTYISEARQREARTKAFRHDIRNHLSVLDGLLGSGNYEEGRAYLKKLEAVSSSLSFPYQTGNPVVDILLGEKLETAASKEIPTDVSLLLPEPWGVDDFDLCVIFANALDNAISACQEGPSPKFIHISGERQGDFFLLKFENTCASSPLPPMGTGLINIRTIAEKYHGAILTEKKDTLFSLHVLLDISLHPENISAQKPCIFTAEP